ncbi:transcriptional regulator-like protein [Isoalcanivorax pacificus W11-5]|uniref:Transcriptional regulator-like protein n=1 Tax=Isoalcanivorax pacificus W11-5 TaxID=391936 RepID=A0A0B4XKR8_9GAMM|nr:WYL domain-containing protein [Isoalcanivorax pacificus]AJD46942.1 transcriptional regulator-like protein [Isoalcanivorax pacificus W11-5]
MSDPKDPLARLLVLYSLIPHYPQRVATSTLHEKLRERGFNISERTLQRDLAGKLSPHFPIGCDDETPPYRWYRMPGSPKDDPLIAENPPGALALYLVEQYLTGLLPQTVLDQMAPRFQEAKRYLESLGTNSLAHWAKRVRALPPGKTLIPAPLKPGVWENVSIALMEQKKLAVDYTSRSKGEQKTLTLNPLGLVSRHSITYLVATVEGYSDLRHFALHRIGQCDVLDASCGETAGFDIDAYIESGVFGWHQGNAETTELVADVSPQVAWLLSETPLSGDQRLEAQPDTDWQRLCATVPKDQETLWWIFGLNCQIKVHKPKEWAEDLKSKSTGMVMLY